VVAVCCVVVVVVLVGMLTDIHTESSGQLVHAPFDGVVACKVYPLVVCPALVVAVVSATTIVTVTVVRGNGINVRELDGVRLDDLGFSALHRRPFQSRRTNDCVLFVIVDVTVAVVAIVLDNAKPSGTKRQCDGSTDPVLVEVVGIVIIVIRTIIVAVPCCWWYYSFVVNERASDVEQLVQKLRTRLVVHHRTTTSIVVVVVVAVAAVVHDVVDALILLWLYLDTIVVVNIVVAKDIIRTLEEYRVAGVCW